MKRSPKLQAAALVTVLLLALSLPALALAPAEAPNARLLLSAPRLTVSQEDQTATVYLYSDQALTVDTVEAVFSSASEELEIGTATSPLPGALCSDTAVVFAAASPLVLSWDEAAGGYLIAAIPVTVKAAAAGTFTVDFEIQVCDLASAEADFAFAGNEPKSTTVTVAAAKPVITSQPADKTVTAGEKATFKVTAAGEGLTYQWQYSKDGGSSWKSKSGATKSSYTVTAKESYDGMLYRCRVTNSGGTVTSRKAKLTVTVPKPVIETQPAAASAAVGETAVFTVAASGSGLTYQWQYSSDYGKTWKNKTGSTAATHAVTVKASYNGMLYRCKVTNSGGTVTSSKVRLTVSGVKPKVLSQPADASAAVGETATFKVVAAGVGMTYQWQYSKDGGATWHNKSGATKSSYTVTAKASYDGILYRCRVTNSVGKVYSDAAALTIG